MAPNVMTSDAARHTLHVDEFKARMAAVSDAAIGVILIRTREAYRCIEVLQEWSIEQSMDFRVWTILTGWQQFPQPGVEAETGDPVDITQPHSKDKIVDLVKAFAAIEDGFPADGCYVFQNPQFGFPHPPFQQHVKGHVQRAMDKRQRVILLVPESVDLPKEVEDDVYIVDFKPPSHAELKTFWNDMLGNIQEEHHPDFSDDEVDLIVQNSLGMTAFEFDTALAMAFVELRDRLTDDKESVTPRDFIKLIMRAKVEVIKKTQLLELMPEARMEEVGGLDLLKAWLTKRRVAFTDGAKGFGISPPKGVLVVGPPGAGKSLFAKAVAYVLGIPCIKFDIGKVFGQFVGQSEANMRAALKLVEAMAPCELLLDEVDKGLGGIGGSGDGGTTSRVLGTFLTWMQERHANAAPIFVTMTANNVTGLPPELLRKGRLDEIFAVTFPGLRERAEIVKIHCTKRGHGLRPEDYRRVAEATPEFVGAELEGIVTEALLTCYNAGTELTADAILDEARGVIPLSRAFPEKVKAMQEWARNNAKPASADMAKQWEPAADAAKTGAAAKTIMRRKPPGLRVNPARRLDD